MNLKDSLSYALDKALELGADKAEGFINEGEKKNLILKLEKCLYLELHFKIL